MAKITIDEYMAMSKEEVEEFHKREQQLIAEGKATPDDFTIDMMGMSDEEIAEKYGFTPMDIVVDRIMKKLSKWQ